MSSYLVSVNHMQYLADLMAEAASNKNHSFNHAVSWFFDQRGFSVYSSSIAECERVAIEVANELYGLNEVAIYGRYNEAPSGVRPIDRIRYTAINSNHVAAYKAFRCLQYQCSEDVADETKLFEHLREMTGNMANSIIMDLPQYEDAEWEITDPRPDGPISIMKMAGL
jgi:hypothetical protein